MADGLKDCPFCGGEAHYGTSRYSRPLSDAEWADGSLITEAHFVSCARCGSGNRDTLTGGHQTRDLAGERWNRRVQL